MNAARTLAEQLRPLAQTMRPVRRIRHVVQITAQLGGGDRDAAIEAARTHCLKWMQSRAGRLPDEAWEGKPFELDTPGKPAEVVTFGELWCARLDDQDRTVPGRVWTTEITLGRAETGALFGLRLLVSAPYDALEFDPSIPGIVRQIAGTPGLLDYGECLSEQPTVLQSEDDVAGLIRLLTNPRRTRPVIVVSLRKSENNPASAPVKVNNLANRCLGIAHVAVLAGPVSYSLTDRIGKTYSVFDGAVRTYLPGFTPFLDRPFNHPLALPDRIAEWGPNGAADFERFVVGNAFSHNTRQPNLEGELPPFSMVKRLSLEHRQKAAARSGDVREQLVSERAQVKYLKDELDAAMELMKEAENTQRGLVSVRDELRANVYRLSARIEALEAQLKAVSRADIEIEIPDSLNELQPWADEYLAGRLTVLERAARAAKDARYQDVPLAYQALLLLAREYCDMRRGVGDGAREAFQARLQKLGLECSPSFSGDRWGEQGDTYIVQWRGQKTLLDMHLKKGNARDEARCLRIYFFWDAEEREVVVGSMPAHLDTRASR